MKVINPKSNKHFVPVGDSDSKSLVLLTQLPKRLMVSTKRGSKKDRNTNWRPSQSECSEGFIQCVSVSKQKIYV